jgi:hypothetical protein
VTYRIVHRCFVAPPRKPLIFRKLWHNYLPAPVPCPGTAQSGPGAADLKFLRRGKFDHELQIEKRH